MGTQCDGPHGLVLGWCHCEQSVKTQATDREVGLRALLAMVLSERAVAWAQGTPPGLRAWWGLGVIREVGTLGG